jgi:hypothetical protein
MEQNPAWEAVRRSAGQEILLLCSVKIRCPVHKRLPQDCVLRQFSAVLNSAFCYLTSVSLLSFHLQQVCSLQVFRLNFASISYLILCVPPNSSSDFMTLKYLGKSTNYESPHMFLVWVWS